MIDLRSDTITRPTEDMLDAMRAASFGDDSRDGDVTVGRLENIAAQLTGKESASFMPSGTMTNLVAVLAYAQRGSEILLEAGAHILNSELGGIAALAGVVYRAIPGNRGAMDINELTAAMRPPSRHNFGTALVCLETSHNRAGGAVLSLSHMRRVRELAEQHRVPVHTDGARIFNAAVALKTPVSSIAQHTDSLCFCISKGLSAPVGSLLCGSSDFIERARAFRRMVGGNMRQAGPLAAAGIVALETMVDRLRADHATAKRLALKLYGLDTSLINPADVETNIVRVQLPRDDSNAVEWSDDLRKAGVLVNPCERDALRFVTHRHIDDADVDHTATVFASRLALRASLANAARSNTA
jgi:threonine aldolase